MADSRDNQTGRMLFTDFDVSDKGRPASPLTDPDILALMPSRLPTIADIASNLELDFEDDGDETPDAPISAFADAAEEENPPPEPEKEDSPRPAAAVPDGGMSKSGDGTGKSPITWEDYTRAYRSAAAGKTSPATGSGLPIPEQPPPLPEKPASDAGFAVGEDDEIGDILSYLSSLPFEEAAETDNYRGARLGVPPPPETPYGGLARVENWFTPPESTAAGSPSALVPAGQDSLRKEDSGSPEARSDDLSPIARQTDKEAGAKKAGGSTQFVDIFSGVNLDEMWSQRVGKARSQAEQDWLPSSDTNLISMFSEIDLDSLWKSHVREVMAKRGTAPAASLSKTQSPVQQQPYPPESFGNPPDAAPGESAPVAHTISGASEDAKYEAGSASEVGKTGEIAAKAKNETQMVNEAFDNRSEIQDEDAEVRPADDAALAVSEGSTPTKPARPARGSREFDLDSMAFDDDENAVVDSSVQAPIIDDSLLIDPETDEEVDTSETGTATETVSGGDAGEDEFADAGFTMGENLAGADTAEYGVDIDPAGDAVQENGQAPSVTPKRKAKRKGLSTDDLLNSLDLDDEIVNDSVSAPVIDDIAIDESVGQQPSTAELLAIAEGPGNSSAVVDPNEAFANIDDIDFSEDGIELDDEMLAMLQDGGEGKVAPETAAIEDEPAQTDADAAETALPWTPKGRLGRVVFPVVALFRKIVPAPVAEKLSRLIAWKENWWFYCDLLALLIATASIAVILSYYIWYRD